MDQGKIAFSLGTLSHSACSESDNHHGGSQLEVEDKIERRGKEVKCCPLSLLAQRKWTERKASKSQRTATGEQARFRAIPGTQSSWPWEMTPGIAS